ncbi:MAG: hypothetical protein ACLQO1_10085 [Steroidobacteraceae bacterium]
MTDKKLTIPELINFHRSMAIRELALATSYPRTHTGIAAHPKLTEDEPPVTPERVVKTAVTSPVEPLRGRPCDNPDPPERVAKPWKKPWDD